MTTTRALLLAATLALPALAGCSKPSSEPAACPDVPAVVFAKSCATAGCHSQVSNAGGLDLESPDIPSRALNYPTTDATIVVLDPLHPEKSALYTKLLEPPPFGGRMPSAKPPLDEATIACVKQWIETAAKAGGGGAGGGAGGSGGGYGSSSGSGGAGGGPDPGSCKVDNPAPMITSTIQMAALPTAAGDTPPIGTYYLTSATYYATDTNPGKDGEPWQITLELDGQLNYNNPEGGSFRYAWVEGALSKEGSGVEAYHNSQLVLVQSCPTLGSQEAFGMTSKDGKLDLFDYPRSRVLSFQKH